MFLPPMHSRQDLFYTPPMTDHSHLSFAEAFNGEHRRRFYEQHRSLALMMILILLLAPFAGLYVTGLLGAVLGLVLSVAAYYLIPLLSVLLGR